MLVLLNAGPLGGQTAEWADDAPDGDIKMIEHDGAKLRYRLDYSEGSATFHGKEDEPAPKTFVSRPLPAHEGEVL